MFKRKGGRGVKGFLNNVKKTALFLHGGFPKEPKYQNSEFFGHLLTISTIGFWYWGFYKGKLAKNEQKIRDLLKFAQNSPENDIQVKQESKTPFLGIFGNKSPIFCTRKRPFSVI